MFNYVISAWIIIRACHYAELLEICLFRFVRVASLFVFNLNHLTTTYDISSRTARPNRCSLCHFDES